MCSLYRSAAGKTIEPSSALRLKILTSAQKNAPRGTSEWSADANERQTELEHAGEDHHRHSADLGLAQEHDGEHEERDHQPVRARKIDGADDGVAAPESGDENRHAGRADEGDGGRAQRGENALEAAGVFVFEIEDGEDRHDDTAWRHTTGGRDDGAGNACDFRADKGGGVEGDRSRCHLGDRDQMGELVHREPGVFADDLFLDQRQRCIAAAEREEPDLEKAHEKLEIDHRSASFRRSSVRMMPSTMQTRTTSMTLTPKKQVTVKATTMIRSAKGECPLTTPAAMS